MTLKDKEIILGVSGGIACYKALEIVRRIKDGGGNVSVVMTQSAMEFVQPLSFQTLSERPVATSLFSLREESKIGHIKIGENADALLIAPATANIIGKAANGIADDYLSTVHLACDAPLILAPAMNHKMWEHGAVQNNLENLRERGATIIPPESGFLACGTHATGRMAEPATILQILDNTLQKNKNEVSDSNSALAGIPVLVTAGPTREKIDAVRYITNYSSGKMGYAIAEYCKRMGAKVTLISGPTALTPPTGMTFIQVDSADSMYQAVMEHARDCKLIIKAAAVGDYRIDNPNPQKNKKKDKLELKLKKTRDILKELGENKKGNQILVGFAAESQNVEEYARKKLKEKNLDMIVANNILEKDAGFGVNTNRVMLIDKNNILELPLLSKDAVAEKIIAAVLSLDCWKEAYSKM
jgi:phosphopantothenoylcysteine decarboxylase / phosphopantothenate---cysteine ligase